MTKQFGRPTAEQLNYEFSLFESSPIVDSSFLSFFPDAGEIEDSRSIVRKILCSLDCERSPLLFSVLEGERGSITSQIAVKMSAETILNRALNFYSSESLNEASEIPLASAIVRESFKEANQQVYQYGHRMGAGGKVAATGFVSAYDGGRFSTARVGGAESFLWREGGVVSLHEESKQMSSRKEAGVLQRFIGANAQVLVDFASVEVVEGDIVVITSLPASGTLFSSVQEIFSKGLSLERAVGELGVRCVRKLASKAQGGTYQLTENVIIAALRVGRPLIRLTDVVGG